MSEQLGRALQPILEELVDEDAEVLDARRSFETLLQALPLVSAEDIEKAVRYSLHSSERPVTWDALDELVLAELDVTDVTDVVSDMLGSSVETCPELVSERTGPALRFSS